MRNRFSKWKQFFNPIYWLKKFKVTERAKHTISHISNLLVPWEHSIKDIESHFGTVVASYFLLLRWLLSINLVISLFFSIFVMIPEYLVQNGRSDFDIANVDFKSSLKNLKKMSFESTFHFDAFVEESYAFYGKFKSNSKLWGWYDVPTAYISVVSFSFIYSFIIISIRIANNASSEISRQDESKTRFSMLVFGGWDFSIGSAETAASKKAALATQFREALSEMKAKEKKVNSWSTIALRLFAHSLFLAMLVGSAVAIIKVSSIPELSYSVGFVMSLITWIYPSLFEILGALERREPADFMKWQLIRVFVLYLGNLATLFGSITNHIEEETRHAHEDQQSVLDHCWETKVGVEMLRLSLFDMVFVLVQIFFQEFFRGLIVRYMNGICCWNLEQGFPGYAEFKLADNILHLIYNQGISWMGTYFSPGLPIIFITKLVQGRQNIFGKISSLFF